MSKTILDTSFDVLIDSNRAISIILTNHHHHHYYRRWIASCLAACGEAGIVPAPIVRSIFLWLVQHHAQPATRSAAILGIFPSLVDILKQGACVELVWPSGLVFYSIHSHALVPLPADAPLCMEAWRLVVEMDRLESLDRQVGLWDMS